MAAEADRSSYFRGEVAAAAVIAVVVLVAVVVAHSSGRLGGTALWILPVVVAIEIALFAVPFWPQVDRDTFYPTTATHEFLAINLDGERVAASDVALYPSTTTYYGIRSVTGHAFAPRTWKEALVTVDPDALRFSETFTTLRTSPEIARSPMLDRLGARYFVAPAQVPLLGAERRSLGALPEVIDPGRTLEYPITAAPAAGVAIPLPTGHDPGTGTSLVTIEVLDEAGSVLSAATRRIPAPLGPTELLVGVPTTDYGATIRISYAGDVGLAVEGRPLDLVTAFPDLPVVFGGSTTIYERRNALERIRWASTSIVEADPAERLGLLMSDLDPTTVVLSAPSMSDEGGEGSIDVVVDEARDSIVLDVSAGGPGYVVVADSLQVGWSATVDGASVDLLEADHVGVAVAVPAGNHRVVLERGSRWLERRAGGVGRLSRRAGCEHRHRHLATQDRGRA